MHALFIHIPSGISLPAKGGTNANKTAPGVADDVLDRGLDVARVVVGVVHPEVGKGFQGWIVILISSAHPHADRLCNAFDGQRAHQRDIKRIDATSKKFDFSS